MNKNRLTLILIGLAIADLLGAIDSTGVNIALPTITKNLGITVVLAQWIPNAYTLVLVGTLIFMGKVGDIVGPKKLYLIGLSLFGLTSLALGFINSPHLLIVVRALQGLGTAILYTMPMSIIAHLWKQREKAFSVTASFFAAGMLIGPLIGGFLTGLNFGHFYGWHLIFLLNIPFIIFAVIIAAKFVPKIETQKFKLDIFSVLLLLAGLSITILSLSIISKWFILVGLFVLLLLYFYEKKVRFPLLDFSLFKNRTFTAFNIISGMTMIAVIGMSFVLTFYLQDVLKWSSMQAGLAFLPVPAITGIVAASSGRLKNWKTGALLTSILVFVGMLLFTQLNPSISYFKLILPAIILIAAGGGILMTTGFAAIIGSAPTEKSGSASGILNTLQQVGSLVGVALVAGIVFKYNFAFYILSVAALIGLAAAFFVRKSENPTKV